MAHSLFRTFACSVLMFAVLSISGIEAENECSKVIDPLTPCIPYLEKGGDNPPPACCNGVRTVNDNAKTTADRRNACNCIKDAAGDIPATIISHHPELLPGKCGVNLPFKISPTIDCSELN